MLGNIVNMIPINKIKIFFFMLFYDRMIIEEKRNYFLFFFAETLVTALYAITEAITVAMG